MPRFCPSCAILLPADSEDPSACGECGGKLVSIEAHDVFVSYASADMDRVQQVSAAFTAAEISHWLAPERIEIGEDFTDQVPGAIHAAKVVVLILSAASIESPWVEREIKLAAELKQPILPFKIEELALTPKWRFLLSGHQWGDGSLELEVSIHRLTARVQEELRSVAATTRTPDEEPPQPAAIKALRGVLASESPYVGPRPFPKRFADKFFGRQHESEALLNLIANSHVVLVYAPSGAGKSSLLNTLISHELDAANYDVLLDGRVGAALPDHIKSAEIRNVFTYSAVYGLDPDRAPHPACNLSGYLRSTARKPHSAGQVLIFDQFEELFTQHAERFEDRKGFFDDVVAALKEDSQLRIVFAMRQEYLADFEWLAAEMPGGFGMQRFPLQRMGPAGALQAVKLPAADHATFAPGVAEEIVRQLRLIRISGFDGVVVEKRGEFVEMVHLQIVCDRLWQSLPEGLTNIEMSHVELASGHESLGQFVVNALDAFYDETIERVVHSKATRDHGGYSERLIRLGCMKFVARDTTRTMVACSNGRVGRLPIWIVEQLENCHLLRAERRGGERWYELAHDRLAEPVGRHIDRNVTMLLHAADLLDKVLRKALDDNGGSLQGYFADHRELLMECQPFDAQPGLFQDEAEFIFRASLVAGEHTEEWSERLAADFPHVRCSVLSDALRNGPARVRRNALEFLRKAQAGELAPEVVQRALSDPDPQARASAATALATWDQQELYDPIFAALDDPAGHANAKAALSRIRIVADGQIRAPTFDAEFGQLRRKMRRRIRHQAWSIRFRESLAILPFIAIPAAIFAGVSSAAFKWLPGAFNLALCQGSASAGMGVFHGMIAGVIWAGGILLAISVYYLVFGRDLARKSTLRPVGAVVAGALAGFATSAVIVLIIASVFEVSSLERMAWIARSLPQRQRFSVPFWRDLFVETRFAWLYLITGTGIGVAMALTVNATRASRDWPDFLRSQDRLTRWSQMLGILRGIVRITLRHSLPLTMVLATASFLAFFVPRTMDAAQPLSLPLPESLKADRVGLALCIVSDCATQIIGTFFGIVGSGLGIVIIRHGVHLDPRRA